MRKFFVLATVALLAGSALADEPAACYQHTDPSGDFTRRTVLAAEPAMAARISHLRNEDSLAIVRCMQKYMAQEGQWPGGAGVLYGARVAPDGKVTQVSVLSAKSVTDPMVLSCLGRTICNWQFDADPAGRELLVKVPPYLFRRPLPHPLRAR